MSPGAERNFASCGFGSGNCDRWLACWHQIRSTSVPDQKFAKLVLRKWGDHDLGRHLRWLAAQPDVAAATTLAGGKCAIHVTNRPRSIGGFVYDCIRTLNDDVPDL